MVYDKARSWALSSYSTLQILSGCWRRTALHQLLCSPCLNLHGCAPVLHQWCRHMDVIKSAPINAEKTQFIWVGSSQMLAKTNNAPLRVGGVDIPLDAVRDLGVILDSNLTMKKHVDGIVRRCFYQLRQLRSVCRSLSFEHALVHAFIHSRVDYCNAILWSQRRGY